jgi:DNA ligase 1
MWILESNPNLFKSDSHTFRMLYSQLVDLYEDLGKNSNRLHKINAVAQLLKLTEVKDLPIIMLLLQGRIFPNYDERKIGVAARLVLKSINIASGIPARKIEQEWKNSGDLGVATQNLMDKKRQAILFSTALEITKVFQNLQNLSELAGKGTVDRKVKIIAELLTSAKPVEAKYIVRTVLEDLRVGIGEGNIRDAIVWAYFPFFKDLYGKSFAPKGKTLTISSSDLPKDLQSYQILVVDANTKAEKQRIAREVYKIIIGAVEEALNLTNDFGVVAETAKSQGMRGLTQIKLQTGTPLKVMLFQKATNMENAFERVGKPAAFEFKYDGFRLQIHNNKDIKLYTRRLEDVTNQFPDVVKAVKSSISAKTYILDAEVIGVDSKGKWLPFQSISQRIKRKHRIQEMVEKIPVIVNIFDAIQIDGTNLLKSPFSDRRKALERVTKQGNSINLAEQLITDSSTQAQKFYEKALDLGNEGLMAKNLQAPYKPGSRVGYGVKLKPTMETLDLVIVGAEWGDGKRSSWLSSYVIACIDDDSGEFLEIGRVSTGLKEKDEEGLSFEELTKQLKPLIIQESGKIVTVSPKVVVQVDYEEIQKSSKYGSGYALRFPRVVSLRVDKPATETSPLSLIEDLFYAQK